MGQKYTSISDLYKQVKLNEQEIIERKLTPQELEDREKIAKKLPMADFKKRYGKDAMAVKMATATNIVKKKSREEDVELDEAKFSKSMVDKLKKAYEPMRGKKINPTPLMKIFDKIDSNKEGLIQLYKADIPFVSMMAMSRLMLKHNMKADEINKLGKIRREDFVLDEKYDLYHDTFSGAMQHAYDYAKKKLGITVDPKEIDSKVATGPRKPTQGKTNKYRLKGKGGNLQIQVFNKGGSKPFELNMYKEETELDEMIPKSTMYALVKDGKVIAKGSKRDMVSKSKKEGGKVYNAPSKKVGDTIKESLDEKFTKKDFAKNEADNEHTKNGVELVKMFGTSEEKRIMAKIAKNHKERGSIIPNEQFLRDRLVKKYYPKLKEEVEINEDGHQDVASAIRQCKTITEDAMQILQKLQTMSPEDALPTWWTNKLAVASNSMNKMRDYLLVPSMSESIELDEKAGDIPDLKKLVGELVKASGMHLAQSKRVQAHVDMMVKANAKGPEGAGGLADLKKIVGELEKASEAHKRQSKSIDAHVDFMEKMEDTQIDEAMKYNFMVLDRDGRVMGMTSGEKDAERQAKGDNIRGETGRVVKLRRPMSTTRGDRLIGQLPAHNLGEEMTSEDSLSNWENADAKGYAEKLIKEYGQPDEVTETMLKWNSLGSFGKGERETYIIDESIPHAFPKPHRDYVYTTMNIKVPSDMLDTLGHVTGSIIYDGLKEEVTARCGSLYANAATLGFVRDMVEGRVTTDKDGAKKEYADRITKDPLPTTYDNRLNEDVSYMCGAECVQESYQEMIARIMSQRSMR